MKWTPQDIKDNLAVRLEKQGSSLAEFEQVLKEAKTIEKLAENTKIAGPLVDLLGHTINLGLLSSLGLGAGAGLIGYQAYNQNQKSTELQRKKIKERMDYEQATKNINDAMQDPTSM